VKERVKKKPQQVSTQDRPILGHYMQNSQAGRPVLDASLGVYICVRNSG